MGDVLVCIKRVPGTSGQVLLTEDGQGVDARHVGWTVGAHDEAAVELAIQVAGETGGTATVLTVGSDDAVEQLRDAVAVGCGAAVLVEADTSVFGPADVAAAIADVVRAHAADGRSYDLVLLGNDASDSGDFQVPVRLAYALERPVVTGVSKVAVEDGVAVATGDGPAGEEEEFRLPLPAVVAVMEGGVSPRYPSVMGRMKAKKVAVEQVPAELTPAGSGRVRLTVPPERPSQVDVLGEGADAAPAVVDLFERLGVLR